jgi:outer membrane protein assembly factor BamB
MNGPKLFHAVGTPASVGLLLLTFFCASSANENIRQADAVLQESGSQGGLVVHLGCGNGERTASLHTGDACIIHGLTMELDQVDAAREHVSSLELYGPVSVDVFDGIHLPYADNLVNLIVVDEQYDVSMPELMRVLAPGGTVRIDDETILMPTHPLTIVRAPNGRTTSKVRIGVKIFVKPRPDEIDEWTHYLHNPSGNPVAQDDQVRPPRQLQWVTSPKWARHHEHMASMSAMVSSDGKIFSICDQGPRESMLHPPEWKLSAHDAFNGLLLWEQPITEWFSHLQPLKNGPASLPRRLVADGGRVYVTLGIAAPVSILDAASGELLHTCEGTENTQEVVLSDGTLFLVRGMETGTAISAVNAASGEILWERETPVSTFTLAADSHKAVYFDGRSVVALNPTDGAELWISPPLDEERMAVWVAKDPPRLILDSRAVIVAPRNKIHAVSTVDGSILWSAAQPRSGYASPKDLFLIDGLVWYGDTAGADNTGAFMGRNVKTGEIERSFEPDIDMIWLSHHRCHFSKATSNFILPARMGVEFVDLENESWRQNHWVRGGCVYGVMPCNGLLYTPPHSCACYFEAKQTGFSAYTSNTGSIRETTDRARLERGPAYGSIPYAESDASDQNWPVFRHDSARSGHTDASVSPNPRPLWSTNIGGKLTQPVVSNGCLYVASVDQNTLYAVDSKTGEPLWHYIAGGRIDSPPTIYQGKAIFGSRDGWIYCLRASDGELAWRFRAYPDELLIMSYGRLESAWPVHGSILISPMARNGSEALDTSTDVLIENEEAHLVAGRNMFLDGGLRYLRLNPTTGELISETVMDETDPLLGGSIQKYDSWLDMTTTMPDILASDETNIYMRSLPFDKEGKRRRISHYPDEGEPARLFSPNGFLEDEWFHRSYWTYARCFPGGWNGHLAAGRNNPSGRLLVMDDATIYGYGRQPQYYRWTTSLEYRLFATERKNDPREVFAWDRFKERESVRFPDMVLDRTLSPPHGERALHEEPFECLWEKNQPAILARAMVSAGDKLYIAGPEDVMDETDLYFRNAREGYDEIAEDLERQAVIWDNAEGAILLTVSKKDGSTLAEHHLDAIPVFDGMIAAEGSLYISLANGELICLGGD